MSLESTSDNVVARSNGERSQPDSPASSNELRSFPPEILLHILSYLDLPDLALIAQVVPELEPLTSDPVLHRYRIFIVTARQALRPTVSDLVHRGVLRGIDRQWRTGAYFYSKSAIIQYENGRELSRRWHRTRMKTNALHSRQMCPDVESSSPNIARSLLPILAKVFKESGVPLGVGAWLANGEYGRRILLDDEKFRLACTSFSLDYIDTSRYVYYPAFSIYPARDTSLLVTIHDAWVEKLKLSNVGANLGDISSSSISKLQNLIPLKNAPISPQDATDPPKLSFPKRRTPNNRAPKFYYRGVHVVRVKQKHVFGPIWVTEDMMLAA
ncbi:hypothetical protein BJ912DRAFT_919936 [Pholiota molesta]|nr:hypothetical protein BJ912DRAFT_919936 [Pholiota molesta]